MAREWAVKQLTRAEKLALIAGWDGVPGETRPSQ